MIEIKNIAVIGGSGSGKTFRICETQSDSDE